MDDIILEIPCVCCHTPHTVKVPQFDLMLWQFGVKAIQDAMPTLTPGERELLISGICEDCWGKMFKENEETS